MRVQYNGLRFELPQGWVDITEDLPSGSPPSLARTTGAGTVQFSIAEYRGGEEPEVTLDDLRKFLREFCQRNGMQTVAMVERKSRLMCVTATSNVNGELIAANYLSNGHDIVLATYICTDTESTELDNDLSDVEKMFASMEF